MHAKKASSELHLTRIFEAPVQAVWAAWTDPSQLAQWWGPKNFTNPVCEIDARPGGAIRIVMQAPDGARYPMVGTYHEVVAPERLVFANHAVDADGKQLLEGLTTVTFAEHNGGTRMTLHTSAVALVADAAKYLDGMDAGWGQSIDRLAAHLAA